MTETSPLATLDYTAEVGGFPFLEVSSISGPSQIEVKYTEAFDGLNQPFADGPWTFSNGLANTFRTETFNITEPGIYSSFFNQGGLRWQSVRLLTNGEIQFSAVGLRPSVEIYPVDSLPGSFSASKQDYSGVWGLGARTVQAACVEAGSQPSTWEVTGQGILIRGQQPAQSVNGTSFSNYTMSFSTKILRGGTGWRVAAGLGGGYGPYFLLTSDYDNEPAFVNTNRTLLPPNSLVFGYGWSIVNQSTLATGPTQTFAIPMRISEDKWYEISTEISASGFNVSVDGQPAAFILIDEAITWANPFFGSSSPTVGTWGFGPFQDQIAFFRDVTVVAENGTRLYTNDFMSNSTLDEYGINTNKHSVCLDGPKRDRLIWTGDFTHTLRTVLASTNRTDFIQGFFQNTFEWQLDAGPGAGLVATDAPLGASSAYKEGYVPSFYPFVDYQIFVLDVVGQYYWYSGDIAILRDYWSNITKLAAAVLAEVDPVTNLAGGDAGDFYFLAQGYFNATAPSALLHLSLQRLAGVATALNDSSAAALYTSTASNLSMAINARLWSDSIGTYSNALLDPNNYTLAATAFPILAGVANTSQATSAISKLSTLFHSIGYKDSSAVPSTNFTQLSPNIQGFLLEALFVAHLNLNVAADVVVPIIANLLDVFWPKMLNQNQYYTGATWEYLYPDGSPGIDLYTSLSHPWGSAPTYVLSSYVLGVRPLEPGYKIWVFEPVLMLELGLQWAEGRVPTPHGTIEARWEIADGNVRMTVKGPSGTSGVCRLRGGKARKVNKRDAEDSVHEVMVTGGERITVVFDI